MFCKRLIDSLIIAADDIGSSPDVPNIASDELGMPAGDYGFAFLKLFLSLIIVIALLGLTVWFLRRLVRYRLEKGSGIQAIRILEKKMISPKTMLYFIEVEGEKILLAESQLEVRQVSISSSNPLPIETITS